MNTIGPFSGKYRFLSNFYTCKIIYDDREWNSTEHIFQAMKTLDFNGQERVRAATVSGSKALGRKIKLRSDWESVKDEVMYEAIKAKFTQNPELLQRLLDTGDDYLIEKSSWCDNIWGSCTCVKCGDEGQNRLGLALMRLRSELLLLNSI